MGNVAFYENLDQIVEAYRENLGKSFQFNIGNEPLAALDALNSIFVNIDAKQLNFVG